MNIAEILKNCPKGTKLYSPLFGECELISVDCTPGSTYPIMIKAEGTSHSFTKDGLFYRGYISAECLLFPSKDNRDWSTFKVPKKYEFKPFDKVLVRDDNTQSWHCDLFSHYENEYPVCVGGIWKQCVLYKDNEKYVGCSNNIY